MARIVGSETEEQDIFPLNEEALIRLIDTVLRRSICPNARSISPSLSTVRECQTLPLCEFAPNIFCRGYSRNFEEQAIFIKGIASILASFWPTSGQNTAQSGIRVRNGAADVNQPGHQPIRELFRQNLWAALALGLRNDKSARRLSPLSLNRCACSSHDEQSRQKPNMESSMAMPEMGGNHVWEGLAKEPKERVYVDIPQAIKDFSESEITGVHHLLNESSTYAVTSSWNEGVEDVAMPGCDDMDLDFGNEMQDDVDIYHYIHGRESSTGPTDERRKRTNSLTQDSDVSMLSALARTVTDTMEEAETLQTSSMIGSDSSLTQNVIRTHPPYVSRRYMREDSADIKSCEERGTGFYESTISQWVGTISGVEPSAITEPYNYHPTQCPLVEVNSRTSITDHGLISIFQDAIYDSGEEENILDFPMTLSSTERERLTETSLSDVLGNDHLLWRMWQRRASVAPRGQEDVEDMKRLYESDPDMKLFGRDWSFDASDMGSSSNGDPMLQDMPTRLRKASSSASPVSERRSYFAQSRSSSNSSSSPGQTPSPGQIRPDPKLQRQGSIYKRFSWGGRHAAVEPAGLELTSRDDRDCEVKRRRMMEDYGPMDKGPNSDDSREMLV